MFGASYFPWRFFWKLFVTQLVVFYALTLGLFVVLLYISELDHSLGLFIRGSIILLVLEALAVTWISRRLAVQFGRVVIKARRIASKKFAKNFSEGEEALFEEELGEFVELERALNRIRRKLKRRKDQLAFEKEEADALMSNIGDGVVRVDRGEQISFFNPQFASRFMETEQLGGVPLLSEVFREPEILETFNSVLESGERREVAALRVFAQDNTERYYAVTVNPLIEKDGEIYGALGIFHDITELKRAEIIRIEFVANASHELRTPLTSLKGYVDTLEEDLKNGQLESAGRFMQIISKNVSRLIDLVGDLLTISNLESQGGGPKEQCDLVSMTENVIRGLSGQAGAKEIELRSHIEVDEVYGESRKIEQIMINLISNAIKYIPSRCVIEVEWVVGHGGGVELHVRDNGPGIAKEHLNRLFERFYRIDRGRSRDAGGTGLGLAIVKHIMQTHGGQVLVKSSMGHGTEFVCTFPLGEAASRPASEEIHLS